MQCNRALLIAVLTFIAIDPRFALGASPSVMHPDGRTPGSATSTASSGSATRPSIAPIGSHPYGHTYGEWAANWWQWALETPGSITPIFDTTGEHCAEGQGDHVWFLAGNLGNGASSPVRRSCVVPVGTALFFPLISSYYGAFLTDPADQKTERFLRSVVACTHVDLSAQIDGVSLADDPKRYFAQSPVFDVQLPEDNLFGASETDIPELLLSPSVAQGYFVFLRPLPAGRHTIRWVASQSCPFGDFAEDVSYSLTVQKARQ